MGCCAFNEIRDLQSVRTAEAAMIAFYQQVRLSPWGGDFALNLGAFYIFTAVVTIKGSGKPCRPYGQEFANYIIKNKLGSLQKTVIRLNRKNEPGHAVRGWIWAPSKANMHAWYKAHKV